MDGINPSVAPSLPPATEHGVQKNNTPGTNFQQIESICIKDHTQINSVKNANNAPIIPELKNLLRDLSDFSIDSINAIMGKVSSDTDANRMTTMQVIVTRLTKKINELSQERIETLKKNHDEQVKVDKKNEENKRKSSGIFGWLKRIFKAVVAILVVAVAVAATIATGGLAAPLLVLAVLALAATSLNIASDVDKEQGGKGYDHITEWMDPASLAGKGAGAVAKEMGASDKDAAIVSASFAIATGLVIMVASAVLSGGATAASGIAKAVAIATAIAGIINGAMSISEALADREIADIERDIAMLQSKIQEILAHYVEASQQREELMEDIKELMNKINELPSILSKIGEEYKKSISQFITNMAGAHLA